MSRHKLTRAQRRRLKILRKAQAKREANAVKLPTEKPAGHYTHRHVEGTGTKAPKHAICRHAGLISIVTLPNGAMLRGASAASLLSTPSQKLLIKCNGVEYTALENVRLPEGYSALSEYVVQTPEIQIDWPDFSTPSLHPLFWVKLYNMLPAGEIVAFCVGGHGRTGTALAALMAASGAYTAAQSIDAVRHLYCRRAIESVEQEDYIKDVERALTGKEPTDKHTSKRCEFYSVNGGRALSGGQNSYIYPPPSPKAQTPVLMQDWNDPLDPAYADALDKRDDYCGCNLHVKYCTGPKCANYGMTDRYGRAVGDGTLSTAMSKDKLPGWSDTSEGDFNERT